MEDPNNLDAVVGVAMSLPTELAIPLLKGGEAKGNFHYACDSSCSAINCNKGREHLKRILQPDCFETGSRDCGHFWGLLETRPYMRLLATLVRSYIHDKQWDKAA
jgi:hypothetical protein